MMIEIEVKGLLAVIERFTTPEPNSGCLLWTGAVGSDGYGRLRFGGVYMRAHRAAWIAIHGPIPPEVMVCHRCDVPACCADGHLFLSDAAGNNTDMRSKDRHARGERHGNSRLTAEDVLVIRRRAAAGEARIDLAAEYGIHEEHLNKIVRGEKWAHLARATAQGCLDDVRGLFRTAVPPSIRAVLPANWPLDKTIGVPVGEFQPPRPVSLESEKEIAIRLLDMMTGGALASLLCYVRDDLLPAFKAGPPNVLRSAIVENVETHLKTLGR